MLFARRKGDDRLLPPHAPQTLHLNLLYQAIERAAARVSRTIAYAGPRKGIVIIEGPFAMANEVLMEAATVSVWLEQDSRVCVKRVLIRGR